MFACSDRRRRLSSAANSVDVYLAACDQNRVAPQSAVVRGLTKHEINVRHRCLGDGDMQALSTALSVREHGTTHIDRRFLYRPIHVFLLLFSILTDHRLKQYSAAAGAALFTTSPIIDILSPRDAMLARYVLSSCVCPSVRPSVRPSHAGVVPKRPNV